MSFSAVFVLVCVGENTHQWEAYPKKSLLTKCREKFPSHESATTCVPRNRKKSVLRCFRLTVTLFSPFFTAPVLRCLRWDWERTFDKLKVNSLYRRKRWSRKDRISRLLLSRPYSRFASQIWILSLINLETTPRWRNVRKAEILIDHAQYGD